MMNRKLSSGRRGALHGQRGWAAAQGGALGWRAVLAMFALMGVVACGGAGDDPRDATDPIGGGDGGEGGDIGMGHSSGSGTAAPCKDGLTRTCRNELGVHGQVKSCFIGLQTCENGVWGACVVSTDGDEGAPAEDANTNAADDEDEGEDGAGGGEPEE